MKEDLIKVFMKNLELTREQAIELINADENDIETVEMKDLAKKAKAVTKGMAKSVDAYGKARMREKIINNEKLDIIEIITNALWEKEDCTKIQSINPEREFLFTKNDIEYKIVLSVPRPKKDPK